MGEDVWDGKREVKALVTSTRVPQNQRWPSGEGCGQTPLFNNTAFRSAPLERFTRRGSHGLLGARAGFGPQVTLASSCDQGFEERSAPREILVTHDEFQPRTAAGQGSLQVIQGTSRTDDARKPVEMILPNFLLRNWQGVTVDIDNLDCIRVHYN